MYGVALVHVVLLDGFVLNGFNLRPFVFLLGIVNPVKDGYYYDRSPFPQHARWTNHHTDTSLSKLQKLCSQLSFEITVDNRVSLLRCVGVQTLMLRLM